MVNFHALFHPKISSTLTGLLFPQNLGMLSLNIQIILIHSLENVNQLSAVSTLIFILPLDNY